MSSPLAVSVLVPTWRRPACLARCLTALAAQAHAPAQVVVVVRAGDAASREVALAARAAGLPVDLVEVTVPGVVHALNAGLARCEGEIVAVTDDDAEPRPEWLERLLVHYAAPDVAGVGGRDVIPAFAAVPLRRRVGLVEWTGRVVGDHHLGKGGAREVDVLKGVNMSFRRELISAVGFDERMRGDGAQVHFEIACSLALRAAGWRLIYDPDAVVDHELAPRQAYDQRDAAFSARATREAAHNETLALLEYLSPARRAAFLTWALAVGTWQAPGAVQWIRALLRRRPAATARWYAASAGRVDGIRHWRAARPVRAAADTQHGAPLALAREGR